MKPLKVLSDLLPIPGYTVIILCFFFPFFLIKCGDTTLMSIKGTDLVTGISKKAMDERMKESIKKSSPYASSSIDDGNEDAPVKDEYAPMDDHQETGKDKKDISPSPFIIISFVMAVAGIIIHLLKNVRKKHLYHLIFSVTGLIGFLLFYLGFQSKMEDMGNNKLGMGLEGKISISYGFGTAFYIASVVFFMLILFYGIFIYFLKNSPESVYGIQEQDEEPHADH